ncbi:MAG: M48 family metalloprotease [archaeon]|nr:M48 family metalloprotease [archaeon]
MRFMWQMRTALSFVLMTLFLMLIGFVVGFIFGYGYLGLTIMLAISVLFSFYSYWFSKSSALRANKVHLVDEHEEPRLYNTVKRVAEKAGLPMPEVGVSEFPMPNAFATGRNPSNAAVVATRGLLNLLNDDELEGVIGHEMSHVKNRDILVMSVASTIVSVMTYASRMMYYSILFGSNRRDENYGVLLAIGIASMIFVPIAGLIMQMAVSRNREYLADETGARITGKPLALANALRRLESGCASPHNTYHDTARADMWISDPVRKKSFFKSVFSTHPSTDERIRRLEILAQKMKADEVPEYTPDEDSSRTKLNFQ